MEIKQTDQTDIIVLEGVAKTIKNIAWLIEFSIIGVGILVSVLLTFNNGFDAPTAVILPGLLFFCLLAIAELSKIPLSQTFVASSSKITKAGSLLVLLIVSFLTAETLIMAGSIVQKQRLEPIILKQNDVERNSNSLVAIENRLANINLFSSATVDEFNKSSNLEIQDLDNQIKRSKDQIKEIFGLNGTSKKKSIGEIISRTSFEKDRVSQEIIKLKTNHTIELKELHNLKIQEMDRSFRKASISKDYAARIEKQREAFLLEKNQLADIIAAKEIHLNELHRELIQAGEITPINNTLVKRLRVTIQDIEARIIFIKKEQKIQQTKYIDSERARETQKQLLLDNIVVLKNNLTDSDTQLHHLKREHFIYQLSGYIFKKDAVDVTDQEYALFNLIFIFSIAIGLSILPSFLAGLSIALRMDKSDEKRGLKVKTLFQRLKDAIDARDYSSLEKYKHENDQAKRKISKLLEEKATANLDYQIINKELLEHQQQLKKRPTVVYEDRVEYVDVPYPVAVPMPAAFQDESSGPSMIDLFNRIFSTKPETPHE